MRVDTLRATLVPVCVTFLSNFFVKSFTLGWCPLRAFQVFEAVGFGLAAPVEGLSSTGADTERTEGFTVDRTDDIAGCLGAGPFPLDRNEASRVSLGAGRVEAIELSK